MAFTYSEAIERIQNQPEPVWKPGMSSDQKLQRLHEVLERFYIYGAWDGLLVDVDDITPTGGIITLDPAYRTLEALRIASESADVSIKPQGWKFSPSAPQFGDWNQYCGPWIAFDLGDSALAPLIQQAVVTGTLNPDATGTYNSIGLFGNQPLYMKAGDTTFFLFYSTGDIVYALGTLPSAGALSGDFWVSGGGTTLPGSYDARGGYTGTATVAVVESPSSGRRYQIAGDPDSIDDLTFSGQAKRRYVYASDTSALVLPDCFPALLDGVRAFHWRDVGDNDRFEREFASALAVLESDLQQVFDLEDFGGLSFDARFSGGSIPNLM